MDGQIHNDEYHLECSTGCVTASVLSKGRPCRVYSAVKERSAGVAQVIRAWIQGGEESEEDESEFVVHLRDDRLYHWTSTYVVLEIDDEQVCSLRLDRDQSPCCYPIGDSRRDVCFFGLEETDTEGYALPFKFRRVAGDSTNYGTVTLALHHVKLSEECPVRPPAAHESSMGVLGSHVLGTEGIEVAPNQLGSFTYLNAKHVPFLTFEFRYRVDVARLARKHKLPPLYSGPAFLMPSRPFGPLETITLSDDEDDDGASLSLPRDRPSSEKRVRKTQSSDLPEEVLVLSSDEEDEEWSDPKRRKERDMSVVEIDDDVQ